jgi:hypothetical protein
LDELVTWSAISREENKLRTIENRVQRRIFGRRRGEAEGGWKQELHDL